MKTFLLGCGAQKAGTTWLGNNLKSSPEYWNGGVKEWRFWKNYFENRSRLLQIHRWKKQLRMTGDPDANVKRRKLNWRISALQNPDAFLKDIIDNFIAQKNIKVLGDMTPINGTLSVDEFTHIKELFFERNIIVKPLIIMRDPFERVWSAVRMEIKNNYPADHQNNQQFVCEKLMKDYKKLGVENRTRYEHMIANLEQVFNQEDIYYGFFENLFSQDDLDRVTNFLGISSLIVDTQSPNPSPIPPQIKQEVIRFYKDTYLFTLDRFGDQVRFFWADSFKYL